MLKNMINNKVQMKNIVGQHIEMMNNDGNMMI